MKNFMYRFSYGGNHIVEWFKLRQDRHHSYERRSCLMKLSSCNLWSMPATKNGNGNPSLSQIVSSHRHVSLRPCFAHFLQDRERHDNFIRVFSNRQNTCKFLFGNCWTSSRSSNRCRQYANFFFLLRNFSHLGRCLKHCFNLWNILNRFSRFLNQSLNQLIKSSFKLLGLYRKLFKNLF